MCWGVVQSDGIDGHTTYRLSLRLSDAGPSADKVPENLYTIYGDATHPMIFPEAYQVQHPFGADIGGVNPLLFPAKPESEFDSWLTVGVTEGNGLIVIATEGIPFDSWSATSPLRVNDGAVFWMDPAAGPSRTKTAGDNVWSKPQMVLPARDVVCFRFHSR